MDKNANLEHFNQICRTCFSISDLEAVSTPEGAIPSDHSYAVDFSLLLLKYLDLRINDNDILPKKICRNCRNIITIFHKFTISCKKKENALEKALSSLIKTEANEECFYPSEDIKMEIEECDLELKEEKETDIPSIEYRQCENFDESVKIEITESDLDWDEVKTPYLSKNQLEFDKIVKTEIVDYKLLPEYDDKPLVDELNKEKTNGELHICLICHKSFKTGRTLYQHNIKHTGVRPFKCKVCKKAFYRKSHLSRHNMIHGSVKPFKCKLCEKAFYQNSHLTQHNMTHTGLKPFKCKVCEKAFYQKVQLIWHNMKHTGVKPFKCKVCEKRFSVKSTLNKHSMIHTGVKPFKCTICEKAFYQNSHLTQHNMTHTGLKPFKCKVCEKEFSQKVQLIRHSMIHTGVKPFKCTICEKALNQKSNLTAPYDTQMRDHIAVHCRASFNYKTVLSSHFKTCPIKNGASCKTKTGKNKGRK